MAQITFVIPARTLDTLHRILSMLSFQKDTGYRAVIVDLAGSEAVRSVGWGDWQDVTGECLVSPDAASLDFVVFSWRNGDARFEIADFSLVNE